MLLPPTPRPPEIRPCSHPGAFVIIKFLAKRLHPVWEFPDWTGLFCDGEGFMKFSMDLSALVTRKEVHALTLSSCGTQIGTALGFDANYRLPAPS
jgi:hypothetical protein